MTAGLRWWKRAASQEPGGREGTDPRASLSLPAVQPGSLALILTLSPGPFMSSALGNGWFALFSSLHPGLCSC